MLYDKPALQEPQISVYPNPANQDISISIKNNKSDKFVIKIFNMLGQEIDRLHPDHFDGGGYQLNWKIKTPLQSGVYFIQFQSNNFNEIQKVVFIK
jgi:hypothetical protein